MQNREHALRDLQHYERSVQRATSQNDRAVFNLTNLAQFVYDSQVFCLLHFQRFVS